MLKQQQYLLPISSTLTHDILKGYIKLFWNDIFNQLINSNADIHLLLLVKVEFTDPTIGYRTLSEVRKVNFIDLVLFT